MKLYKKIFKTGTLTLITGLHIGDSGDTSGIGGVDSPIIRRKDNNEPYIPGSSLKGKMRSLLDIAHGQSDTSRNGDHIIGRLFGNIDKAKGVPSRLIVRDAYLSRDSEDKLANSDFTDMPYSEVKFENVINRIKGTAEHPRQIERVPAGAIFNVEYVINILGETDEEAYKNEQEFLALFDAGIKLLEDDYIGGSGSRGYGQIEFKWNEIKVKTVEDYLNGN